MHKPQSCDKACDIYKLEPNVSMHGRFPQGCSCHPQSIHDTLKDAERGAARTRVSTPNNDNGKK